MATPDPEQNEANRPDHVAGVDERPQRRREWAGGLRSVVLPVLIVAAIVGAVWYLQRDRGGNGGQAAGGTGIVALPADKNPTGKAPAVETGRAAPDFVLTTLDGGRVRLSDLRGKNVVVNFWATWCGPCRAEMPELVKTYAEQKANGLEILAVDLQEQDDKVGDFAAEFGMTFPVLMDRTGEVAEAYGVRGAGLPATVFIDRQGVVRVLKIGAMNGEFLRARLAELP